MGSSHFAIVIPVLNESDGLSAILPRIDSSTEVIIVDDGSTDGTKDLVGRAKNVLFIERKKKMGLVSAYLDGMKRALELGAEYIGVMDGDGQHDPSYMDGMVKAAADQGAGLVLGSRYLSIDASGWEDVGWFRRLVSRVANGMFKVSFGDGPSDVTTGFRVYSRQAAEHLLRRPPRGCSYAGQVEIVEELRRAGIKIVEYPIIIDKRVSGKSKLSLKDVLNYFSFVLTRGNLWKYTLVGLSGVLVSELALWALAPLNVFVADLLAIELSIASNFLLNESWAFRGRKPRMGVKAIMSRLGPHNIYSISGLIVNFLVFAGLDMAGMNPLLSNLVGIAAAYIYATSRLARVK